MLRPRASDMTGLAVPDSLAARLTERGRHGQKPVAPKRPTMTQVTSHARLRLAWPAAPARQHSQPPEAATAMRSPRRRVRRIWPPCPARCWDFPTIAARTAGRRRGTSPGCRARWRGSSPAMPARPGGCTSNRVRMELYAVDAAFGCIEPSRAPNSASVASFSPALLVGNQPFHPNRGASALLSLTGGTASAASTGLTTKLVWSPR